MWYIFGQLGVVRYLHPVETVRNIWVMAVHTLKGQYHDLISDELNDKNARLSFLSHWQNGQF
jgi:hypothetical protein